MRAAGSIVSIRAAMRENSGVGRRRICGVIQTGSRVEYVYLFAGDDTALASYYQWLKPRLGPSHEWESVRDGETFSRSRRWGAPIIWWASAVIRTTRQ